MSDWLYTLESCESTNTWALDRLAQFKHGDVIFTRHQTAGRGQFDRIWLSESGTLTASFILELSIAQLSGFSLIAGLAVIQAIETLLPDQTDTLKLKWTNDIFIAGRKLAGILCESRLQSNQARIVVGIGLNRTSTPQTLTHAISLHELSTTVPDEQTLLIQLRTCLLQFCQQPLVEFLPELRKRDALFRKIIVFETSQKTVIGEASGIDSEGQLLIRLPEGIHTFRSGRVLEIR